MKSTDQAIEELKQEKAELSKKIKKLKRFLSNEKLVVKVGKQHVFLLQRQLYSMENYAFWLRSRIRNLKRELEK